MKLSHRLTLFVALGATLVLSLHAWLGARRAVNLFDGDMLRDHQAVGRALAATGAAVWRDNGPERARVALELASRSEASLRVEWVWIDDGPQKGGLTPDQRGRLLESQETSVVRTGATSRVLHSYFLIPATGSRRAALDISEPLASRDEYVKTSVAQSVATAGVLAFMAFLITALLGRALVGKPVSELVEQAHRIGAGDLSRRVIPRHEDELGSLAEAINAMSDRLLEAQERLARETAARIAALEQLRHADRLVTIGKLASGVAHELGTPLAVVAGRAKLMVRKPSPEMVRENARIIGEQADRMASIVRQLLEFASQREPLKSRTQLDGLVGKTLALLDPLAARRSVTLEMKRSGGLPDLELDSAQIQQVITNLVTNGVHAASEAGKVTVELGLERRKAPAEFGGEERQYVKLTVVDQGSGIDPAIRERIFEPFFTTKDVGEGTGLGLSVAYGIVREHQGFIDVDSLPGAGSRFSVYLPVQTT